MANIPYLHIHGSSGLSGSDPNSVTNYSNSPDLYAYISYTDPTRNGNTVSLSLSGGLIRSSIDGSQTRYTYKFVVYAALSTDAGTNGNTYNSQSGLVELINKPSGTNTWSDGYKSFTNKSVSVSTSSTTVYLRFFMSAYCVNCADDFHSGVKGDIVQIWSVQLTAPSSGYTITFKDANNNTTKTLTGQTNLPTQAQSTSASFGNLTTPQNYGGLVYTFKNWELPSGYSNWGQALSGNVTLKSKWGVGSYSLTSSQTGSTYIAKFYGYDGIFTVRIDEAISATCNYTVTDYVTGNTKPTKQTTFTMPTAHLTAPISIGRPVRSTMYDTSSNWKPETSTTTYNNGDTVSFSGSGTVDGNRQTYSISGTVTANVVITGNANTYHYVEFYDVNRKFHKITNIDQYYTYLTFTPGTTETKEVKSYWHAPQIWKYRENGGKNTGTENSSGTGWNWWKDVELRKYDNSTQSWIYRKWNSSTSSWDYIKKRKVVGTTWVNCDTDLQINR